MLHRSRVACMGIANGKDWFLLMFRDSFVKSPLEACCTCLPRDLFLESLEFERARTMRSGRRVVLMLAECKNTRHSEAARTLRIVSTGLVRATRITDIVGWYGDRVVGLILTEVGDVDDKVIAASLTQRLRNILFHTLEDSQRATVGLSFHVFPESGSAASHRVSYSVVHAEYAGSGQRRKAAGRVRRLLDVAASLFAIGLLIPMPALQIHHAPVPRSSPQVAVRNSLPNGRCTATQRLQDFGYPSEAKSHA